MTSDKAALERRIDQLSEGFSGKLSLYVRDLASGETILRDPDAVVPTASCIKFFILLELMRRVAAGEFRLESRIPVRANQQAGGSGILKDLSAGIELPLRDVAVLMIALSDNTATNMLVDLLGREAINATIRGMGLTGTVLHNKVDFEAIGDDVRRFAVGTAREFGIALQQVAEGRFVDRATSDAVIDIMERQQYLDLLPRYLPYNPYARELKAAQALRVANKTGFYMGVRCDAALLMLPKRTLVAVAFTRDGRDLSFNPENENAVFVGRVGEAVYEYFSQL
ncbi:MAG: serine hydrolase [Dongiaceae bacterium]